MSLSNDVDAVAIFNGGTPSLRFEAVGVQPVDDVFDDRIRRAGGGAESKRFDVIKIFWLKLLGVLNKPRVACRNAR